MQKKNKINKGNKAWIVEAQGRRSGQRSNYMGQRSGGFKLGLGQNGVRDWGKVALGTGTKGLGAGAKGMSLFFLILIF